MSGRLQTDYTTVDALVAMVRGGISALAAAQHLGITRNVARYWLRRRGVCSQHRGGRPRTRVPRRSRYCKPTPTQEAEVLRRYAGLEGMRQIAADLGLTEWAVRRVLERNGVDIRRPGPLPRVVQGGL